MATRNVVLTAQQDKLIKRLVKSGRYQNASEVMREGIRLVARREAQDAAQLKALRAAIQVGLDDMTQGKFREFDDVTAFGRYIDEQAARAIDRARKRA